MPLSKIDSDSLNTPITAVDLAYTGTLTGGTGIVNLGSGQVYKDASGNVGVGTSSPNYLTTFYKASLPALQLANSTSGSTGSDGLLIYLNGANATISNEEAGYMNFQTSGTERVRITSGGGVRIGGSFTSGASKLAVNNTNNVSGDQSTVFELGANCNNTSSYHLICATGTNDKLYILGNGNVQNVNNSYGSLSDIKLKENIADATPKLADLMQVKVRNYNLIGDTTKQIGVVAQELETVFPSMVEEITDRDEDGNTLETTTKSVKYSVFVPMLIKSIQELKAIVDAQGAEIAALKGTP